MLLPELVELFFGDALNLLFANRIFSFAEIPALAFLFFLRSVTNPFRLRNPSPPIDTDLH